MKWAITITLALFFGFSIWAVIYRSGNQTETTNKPTVTEYTTADVATHNQTTDCWLILNTQVYDITQFLSSHPGTPEAITPYCGQDATQAFTDDTVGHQHSENATRLSENYRIGILAPAALTSTVVAQHATPTDCWIIIQNTVYDVTNYLRDHPAPAGLIEPYCGQDATTAFETKNTESSHTRGAWELLNDFKIGPLE